MVWAPACARAMGWPIMRFRCTSSSRRRGPIAPSLSETATLVHDGMGPRLREGDVVADHALSLHIVLAKAGTDSTFAERGSNDGTRWYGPPPARGRCGGRSC